MTNQVAERDSECFYVERGGYSHYFSMETNVNTYHLAKEDGGKLVHCLCPQVVLIQ